MSKFCFQCGLERRPVPAVGVDEDGEAACSGHSVKNGAGLNAAEDMSAPAPAPEPTPTAVTIHDFKKGNKETMPRQFQERTCSCGCGKEFMPTGSTQRFAPGHKLSAKSTHARIDRVVDHVNREIGVAQDVPLHERIAGNGSGTQTEPVNLVEPTVTLVLPVSKVQKLLTILLFA